VIVPPSRGSAQTARITEALAGCEPSLLESDYRAAFTTAVTRMPGRSLIVLLTDLVGPVVEEALMPALGILVRHHVVVVGSVADPEVGEWSAGAVHEAADAYRRVAAIGTVERRTAIGARLAGAGITVVDQPPGRLAPSLADAYLRVKSTGRL
jgi:uncharacterized protein (DUF58 family)